jgi:UDP:flavonoid glycosyltransferase YjiC (YdhE family)
VGLPKSTVRGIRSVCTIIRAYVRILFTPSPSLGHFLPVVSTAWAARTAGHDVLVAAAGPSLTASAQAGLPAFDAAPALDLSELLRTSMHWDGAAGTAPPGARIYAAVSDRMADRTVAVARLWQPDVVVDTPLQATGPLVAGLLSVPLVRQSFGLSVPRKTAALVLEAIRAACERNGMHGSPPGPAAELDTCPPSMIGPSGRSGWAVRYIPYNGGGALPDWLIEPAPRRRICVTLGSVVPIVGGVSALAGVIEAVRDLDAEVILALGEADAAPLGALPANVRPVAWVPLSALVPTCAAIVHHGGSGTTMNALVAGVPQLVLPQIADQYANARSVQRRGAGIAGDIGNADAVSVGAALRRLLEDPDIGRAADEVRREIAGLPPPSEVVPRFTDLAVPA